jgi:hypothetical protein
MIPATLVRWCLRAPEASEALALLKGDLAVNDPGYGQARPYGDASGQGAGHPAPGGMPGMPYPSQDTVSTKGFLASLFDVSFGSYVTPRVIKVVYVIIMIVIGLSTLGYIIFGFAAFKAVGIIFVPVALLIGLIYLALARIGFEIVMVIFRMGDDIHAMRGSR